MLELTINGERFAFEGDPQLPLLWVLRENLQLTGSKFGCGIGICGACTVHVDGAPQRSCILPVSGVAGKEITTIEGLSDDGRHPLQLAWIEENTPQCGYCQSGQIMSAAALLASHPTPSDARTGDVWKPVPLRHLSAHPASDSPRLPCDVEGRNIDRGGPNVKLSRRQFLQVGSLVGGSLMVGFTLAFDKRPPYPNSIPGAFQPNAFIQVTPDGRIVLQIHKTEMGQGILTGLTTLVAEELNISPRNIETEFSGIHPDYKNPQFDLQITNASSSIITCYEPVRQAAAATRMLLLEAAGVSDRKSS